MKYNSHKKFNYILKNKILTRAFQTYHIKSSIVLGQVQFKPWYKLFKTSKNTFHVDNFIDCKKKSFPSWESYSAKK